MLQLLVLLLICSASAFHLPVRPVLRSSHLLHSSTTDSTVISRQAKEPKEPKDPLAVIAHELFAASKQTLSQEVLHALLRSLEEESARPQIVPVKVAAQLLYSLQMFRSHDATGTEFVKLFTALLPTSETFGGQAVGMSLLGLRRMSCDNKHVLHLLAELTAKIDACTEPLSAQTVGNALYGLGAMSSSHAEVRDLLRVLTPKIDTCTEPLSLVHIRLALARLQRMYMTHTEVRDLLNVVVKKMRESEEIVKRQEDASDA
ncbi:hypothetical protein B484DRAFT_448204 [Ochromonadaceae sp. CCMP2298]|nr:hypothetical protein B484DRAFT_448204 [Ochromonadaceae sp. CCMP2298]